MPLIARGKSTRTCVHMSAHVCLTTWHIHLFISITTFLLPQHKQRFFQSVKIIHSSDSILYISALTATLYTTLHAVVPSLMHCTFQTVKRVLWPTGGLQLTAGRQKMAGEWAVQGYRRRKAGLNACKGGLLTNSEKRAWGQRLSFAHFFSDAINLSKIQTIK